MGVSAPQRTQRHNQGVQQPAMQNGLNYSPGFAFGSSPPNQGNRPQPSMHGQGKGAAMQGRQPLYQTQPSAPTPRPNVNYSPGFAAPTPRPDVIYSPGFGFGSSPPNQRGAAPTPRPDVIYSPGFGFGSSPPNQGGALAPMPTPRPDVNYSPGFADPMQGNLAPRPRGN